MSSEEEPAVSGQAQDTSYETEQHEAPSATSASAETEVQIPPIGDELEKELSETGSAFVYDVQKGFLLCLGDLNAPLWPASTTKLVTALVALESIPADTVLTAGDELDLVISGASIAWITKGQSLTVRMLVEAMLLPSGCDAAYVLAAGVGRYCDPDCTDAVAAVKVFVDRMNDWSDRHGLSGSHWENPDGNHSDGHYSCLADLCRVACLAMENDIVRQYCATQQEGVVYASGEINEWSNTNLLLSKESRYYNEDCVGLKTGHTTEGGYCLLSAFENQEQTLLVGVFGCPTTGERFRVTNVLQRYYAAVKEAAA